MSDVVFHQSPSPVHWEVLQRCWRSALRKRLRGNPVPQRRRLQCRSRPFRLQPVWAATDLRVWPALLPDLCNCHCMQSNHGGHVRTWLPRWEPGPQAPHPKAMPVQPVMWQSPLWDQGCLLYRRALPHGLAMPAGDRGMLGIAKPALWWQPPSAQPTRGQHRFGSTDSSRQRDRRPGVSGHR